MLAARPPSEPLRDHELQPPTDEGDRLMYGLSARVIVIVVGVLLIVGVLLWGPAACQKIRSLGAQSKIDQAQGGAFQNSASDAVTTQGDTNKRETESEATTRSNEKDIRNAEGANDAVNPAVRDAGFASLCKRPSFRRSEAGKLHCPPAS
jgi:hypothetical protein